MIHLHGGGTDLVVDVDTGVPVVVHWGAPLGDTSTRPGWLRSPAPSTAHSCRVARRRRSDRVVLQHGSGFPGRAGFGATARVAGRGRRAFVPTDTSGRWRTRRRGIDPIARLRLTTTFELGHTLVVRVVIVNEGDDRYMLDGLG